MNPILKRIFHIREISTGLYSIIKIEFFPPETIDEDDIKITSTVSCNFFSKTFWTVSHDDFQALTSLMEIIAIYLEGFLDEGYEMYWWNPGDLQFEDFWQCGIRRPDNALSRGD